MKTLLSFAILCAGTTLLGQPAAPTKPEASKEAQPACYYDGYPATPQLTQAACEKIGGAWIAPTVWPEVKSAQVVLTPLSCDHCSVGGAPAPSIITTCHDGWCEDTTMLPPADFTTGRPPTLYRSRTPHPKAHPKGNYPKANAAYYPGWVNIECYATGSCSAPFIPHGDCTHDYDTAAPGATMQHYRCQPDVDLAVTVPDNKAVESKLREIRAECRGISVLSVISAGSLFGVFGFIIVEMRGKRNEG
jgi:hypothetical protein